MHVLWSVTSFEELFHDETATDRQGLDTRVIGADQQAEGIFYIHQLDN